MQEVSDTDEEGCWVVRHVLGIRVEETGAEEGLFEVAGQGLEEEFRIRCREERLHTISLEFKVEVLC